MLRPFPQLCAAILDDDLEALKTRVKSTPGLARKGVAEEEWLDPRIAHWIYAGDSALHVAAAGYRVEIANLLLAAGADVTASNRRGSLPLHYAADGHLDSPAWNPARQVAMIRLLLRAGSPVDAQDKNGATPLHRAVRTRCAAAVKYLLDSGADPSAFNNSGSTPFHLAVQNTGRGGSGTEAARAAQREILQAFLQRGVKPTQLDSKGKSVLKWARSGDMKAMLAELQA